MAAAAVPCQGSDMAKQDAEREQRLAEALRANLRRRKAQARGVEASSDPPVRDGHRDRDRDENAH